MSPSWRADSSPLCTCPDEEQCATAAEGDPKSLLACDGLFENQCREDEGEDGHRRGHDTRIHWAGQAESDGEAALIAHESEDCSPDEEELISLLHLLPWCEEGGDPKEDRSA